MKIKNIESILSFYFDAIFFGSQYQPAETFSDDDLIQRANEIKDTSRIGAKTSILTDMRLVLRILSKLADAAEVSQYNRPILYILITVFFKKNKKHIFQFICLFWNFFLIVCCWLFVLIIFF